MSDNEIDCAEAASFVGLFPWCAEVVHCELVSTSSWVQFCRVDIVPGDGADSELWVVSGDLSPAYFDRKSCPKASDAEGAYLYWLEKWSDAASKSSWSDQIMPLYYRYSRTELEMVPEYAKLGKNRFDFMKLVHTQGYDAERVDVPGTPWPSEPPRPDLLLPANTLDLLGPDISSIVRSQLSLAEQYLKLQRPGIRLMNQYLYRGFEKLAIFFFEYIDSKGINNSVWIIAGDTPPAMISAKEHISGVAALGAYRKFLATWLERLASGQSTADLNALLTAGGVAEIELSSQVERMLENRVRLISTQLIPIWREEDVAGISVRESQFGYT